MGRRAVILGGSGQVGSALQRSVPSGFETFAPSSSQLDICDRSQVDEAFAGIKPDVVINAAAYTNVERAELERDRAFEVNAKGAANVARACDSSPTLLVHVSTDYVFDGTKHGAYVEGDEPCPANVYGLSKLGGEQAVITTLERYLILRVSWVFSSIGSNFVKTMIGLAGKEEVRVVDDQWGTPCAAADIANCIWGMIGGGDRSSSNRIYHFSSKPVTTWYGFARPIFSALERHSSGLRVPTVVPITTEEYPTRAVRPGNSVLDGSKLQQCYGIHPPDWRDALDVVVRQLAADR